MVVVDELVDVLDRERHLLESLVFRLIEARGLLATGEARFLGWAASDIEAASAAVREIELRRATILSDMSEGGPPTMAVLVHSAEEPWSTLLAAHRSALGRLAGELGAALEATHDLAEAGLQRVRAAGSNHLAENPDGVGEHLGTRWARTPKEAGRRERDASMQPRHSQPFADLDDLDLEITAAGYEAVLAATDRMALPSLIAFLA